MRSAWWIVPFALLLSAEWWLRRRSDWPDSLRQVLLDEVETSFLSSRKRTRRTVLPLTNDEAPAITLLVPR